MIIRPSILTKQIDDSPSDDHFGQPRLLARIPCREPSVVHTCQCGRFADCRNHKAMSAALSHIPAARDLPRHETDDLEKVGILEELFELLFRVHATLS